MYYNIADQHGRFISSLQNPIEPPSWHGCFRHLNSSTEMARQNDQQEQHNKRAQESDASRPHSKQDFLTKLYALAYILLMHSQKEDYIQAFMNILNKPVTLYFEPLSLEVKFEKVLKMQIAIFRQSPEEAKGSKRAVKMDKTDPVKFTNPHERITFSKTLSLLTTLPFNPDTHTFDSKEVDMEMALEIDGRKERMGKKVNLKDVLLSNSKTFKFTQEAPPITLLYRAEVKLEDERADRGNQEPPRRPEAMQQPPRRAEEKKPTRVIRFDEEPANTKENQKRQIEPQPMRPQRIDKGRHKTVFFQPPQAEAKIIDNQSQQSQNTKMKKYKSLDKPINPSEPQEKQSKTDTRKTLQLESKIEEYRQKLAKLESSNGVLQKMNQQLEKRLKEREGKLAQITHKYEDLQQKMHNELKSFKRDKEERKDMARMHSETVNQLKEDIRSYQGQIQKLRKTAMNFQESTKHIASGSQQEIRSLRDKIAQLERQNAQSSKQVDVLEQSLSNKDEIINDLKAKIYALDKENLQLQNKVKSAQTKLAKSKEEYQQQVQQLQNKIDEMKEDNKNFKIATLKDIKDDNTVDYKKKVEALQKQLQKKEQLLRKMTDMKKESESQRSNEAASLKKEVSSLKETIQKLQTSKSHGSETSDIQIKIQLEKLKKEVDTCRKNEKALLIEKGKLQASNRTLQDDIVKNKCAIANILNAVQETGNEKLITEVYCLTE